MLKDFLFRRELRIDGKQVGPGNLIKPSALIWIFMETSEAHMNAMGWNHQRLAETGLAFLIIHNSTQLKRLPAFDEQLIVETAPIGCHGAQFYRGFRLLANDGEVGRMTQVSVLVDANTHQLMRPKSFFSWESSRKRKWTQNGSLHPHMLANFCCHGEKERFITPIWITIIT